MKIYKDYQRVLDNLCKYGINEQKHLLWKEGGVPCIDAKVWEENKNWIKDIVIRTTKGRRFRVDGKVFDLNKKEIDFGHGKQYIITKELWDISDGKQSIPEQLIIQ